MSRSKSGTGNPILFVTQVPVYESFTGITSAFGNHLSALTSVPRGGDLYIRYPTGALRNLTREAGFGSATMQGATAIAVRDPAVHWSGKKAVFSMLIGAPSRPYETVDSKWQLYEVTGLGAREHVVIQRVNGQPTEFNNISPCYGTDDRILFTSDRPRSGESHLYPQLDEYEEAPTVSGIWSLDPLRGDLFLLNHSPSGAFSPSIDRYGRVVFVRWDHLVRDQQADSDAFLGGDHGTFNYADESADAARLNSRDEVFPEPRPARTDLLAGTNLVGLAVNHFFPWQINEDGTGEETLNHVGRHDLHGYFTRSFNDDPALSDFFLPQPRQNPNVVGNILQLREDPSNEGEYVAIDAPEFGTHAAGQILSWSSPPDLPADQIQIKYVTHRSTAAYTSDNQVPENSGKYRDPLPLSDGRMIASHTPNTTSDENIGTADEPQSSYQFRLKEIVRGPGDYAVAGDPLTDGFTKTISYYVGATLRTSEVHLWELGAVEVRERERPAQRSEALEAPEQQMFAAAGVDVAALRDALRASNLALVVSRNVTARDKYDHQQPYNLRVAGTNTQTVVGNGKVYDVAYLQFFQGDQIRGLEGTANPRPGRRVLAQALHDPAALATNQPSAGPAGSVALGSDGSMAAFVPARRALSWQLTDPAGTPVVRDRYWITFQPGEVRVCANCHGVSSQDQIGRPAPTNPPEALRTLLEFWKNHVP